MDVPFVSSGAISRVHYALVRRVESADTTQLADQHILAEVQSIRRRLAQSTPSLKQCKEYLIILLYCSTSITTHSLKLDFALPYAVNLAEAGRVFQDKKIGYLFCTEVMPLDHELQLMLVNTIRKDLESSLVPQICLALDALITSSTPEVVPAVQDRLHDLLSHNSFHVRRRAILACRAVSRHNSEIIERASDSLLRRLQDSQSAVASVALLAVCDLVKAHSSFRDDVRKIIASSLMSLGPESLTKPGYLLILNILRALRVVGLPRENVKVVLKLVRSAARSRLYSLLYGAILLLSDLPWDTLNDAQTSSRISSTDTIRHLLTSRDINEQYLFLCCLGCLDPRLWAGTTADIPAVLEGWEVERVMQFLDSPDTLIRNKTLKILYRIDVDIVEKYCSQLLQNFPRMAPVNERNEASVRILEIVEIQCSEDGESYAQKLKVLFGVVDGEPFDGKHPVLDNVVENVLRYIRGTTATFRIGCVTSLLTSLAESDIPIVSTFMVILCALATECCSLVSISPISIVLGFSDRLSLYSPSVQEACLLSMLRIVAELDEIPQKTLENVTKLGESAGRHIRRRCNQFISLCGQKHILLEIIAKAHTTTLPAFIRALDTLDLKSSGFADDRPSPKIPPSRSGNPSPSPSALSSSKLRYAAYEPPRPVARLRGPLNTTRNSSRSSNFSGDQGELRSPKNSDERRLVEELSNTVTAGDLALAAGNIELEKITKVQSESASPKSRATEDMIMDDLSPRTDLIVLDSPFISDPSESLATSQDVGSDFEEKWNVFENGDARGWCESSADVVVRRLQRLTLDMKVIAADRPPFEGELKILMVDEMRQMAIRLRDNEEDGCLWRLRCNDDVFRTNVKRLLTEP